MPYWIITFFLGVCSLLTCPFLPSLYWLLILFPIFFLWFLFSGKIKKVFWQIFLFFLGFGWSLLYVSFIVSWSLPHNLENKNILIKGYVIESPVRLSHRVSFKFKTESVGGEKKKVKLKLSWYGDYPNLKVGDRWQLFVRLKRPRGNANPGGFDVEKYSLVNQIRARGYVVKSKFNQLLLVYSYKYPFERFRQILIERLDGVLGDAGSSSIIIALVTGSKEKITKKEWQIIRSTGVGHLMAISGLHIGLVAGVFIFIFSFLWKRSYRLLLIMPARDAGVIGGLFFALIYSLITGFSISSQRALVMLLVFSLMFILRRHTNPWNGLLWSLFVVLIINPLSVLSIGFWMSFAAVFTIIYVSFGRIGSDVSYFKKFWLMQLSLILVLLPFSLFFFQQFSYVSFAANALAVPGMCLLVIPLSLFGVFSLFFSEMFAGWILWCSTKILHVIWWWLEFLVSSLGGNWYYPVFNWWIMLAAILGSMILLLPRGFPCRLVGILWFFPLFFYEPPSPSSDDEFWVTLLDVGQGLAAVVQTKNHVLVYDTGPKFFESDSGARIIIPYLRLAGVKSIDTMVISHGDSDHSGGAQSILNVFPVRNILVGETMKFIPNTKRCFFGQKWQWDGVRFQILSPAKNSPFVGNDSSCVLKITSSNGSFLLPGDIEYSAEAVLVKNHAKLLKSDALIAPHHGSSTSSTSDFVREVEPQYAVFSVGYKNRFRFPHKKVVSRYTKIGTKLLDTAKLGAITFKFDVKSDILRISNYRESNKHFWSDI